MASCRKWILNIHSFTIWIKNEQLPVEHTFWWPILRKKFHEIFTLVWEAISKTRASGFIRRSKHLETIKALGRSGLVLSSVSQCLEPLIKPSHSWLIYYIKGSTCLLLNLWMAPCTQLPLLSLFEVSNAWWRKWSYGQKLLTSEYTLVYINMDKGHSFIVH